MLYRNEHVNTDHSYNTTDENFRKFSNIVNRGGLIQGSTIVYQIANFTEKHIPYLIDTKELLKNTRNIKHLMTNIPVNYFSTHRYLFKPKHPPVEGLLFEDFHKTQLIKKIINIFFKCRLHHHTKVLNISRFT